MWSAFHRAIFTIAMTLVKLSIVADRLWEVLSSRIAADDLGILFQEGIHHFDQLASNAHDHSGLPAIRLPFLIVDALSRNESCVELGPLCVSIDQVADDKKHHLFGCSCSRMGQLHPIERRFPTDPSSGPTPSRI